MTLCQHGVQTGTGYECSACLTTPPRELAALGVATAALDEVLKLLGRPASTRTDAPAAALEDVAALREEIANYAVVSFGQGAGGFHDVSKAKVIARTHEMQESIAGRLDRIEQYLRSEQR
jgi:hypothetical protein